MGAENVEFFEEMRPGVLVLAKTEVPSSLGAVRVLTRGDYPLGVTQGVLSRPDFVRYLCCSLFVRKTDRA